MSRRFAIYAAPPPEDPLWTFGSSLLGWDAAAAASVPFPADRPADEPTWTEWTAAPRLYGFHGTLKAPFRLRENASMLDIESIATELARSRSELTLPRMEVGLLGSFVAIVPAASSAALQDLAAACVEGFEPIRAPLDAAETAKRLRSPLTARQRGLLDRFGYPYVLDQFRFHMTLTGRLPTDEAERVRAHLAASHARLDPSFTVDALVLFVQEAPGERFRIARRFPLRR